MDKVLCIIALCIAHCYGSVLIDYHLGENFGQKIIDYSGNGMHAVNGDNSTIDSYDTIPTDRGAYFPLGLVATYDYHILMMPNEYNKDTSYIFPETFSMSTWSMLLTAVNSVIFHRKTNLKLKFHDNYIPVLKIVLSSSTQVISGTDSTFPLGKIHIGTWAFIVVTVQANIVTLYTNGQVSTKFEGIFIFQDLTTSPYTYIGGINGGPSMHGYMWSFTLYSDIIVQSDYVSPGYALGNCMVENCTSVCNGIIKDGSTYCISSETDWFENGAGVACPINCTYGCSGSLCLDCQCNDKSCVISNSEVICWCPVNGIGYSTDCICDEGYYKSDDSCLPCSSECKTCDEIDKCLTCIANNTEPTITVGCECINGYYGSSLTNVNSCLACFEECETCYEANICLSCITLNATPNNIQGCSCNSGFYGNTLIYLDSCISCYEECATCSSANICSYCKASNSSPSPIQGCLCDNGYYGSTLINIDSCKACFQECETCLSANICINCKALNASPSPVQGCLCDDGYYASDSLSLSNGCSICHSDCITCEEADKCLLCIAENSIPDTIGCTCSDGFYVLSINPLNCSACLDQCETCTNSSSCTTCKVQHANFISGSCNCPENSIEVNFLCICNDRFFLAVSSNNESICLNCSAKCKTCYSDGNNDYCLSCNNPEDILTDTGDCITACSDGYYYENGICVICLNLCNSCNNEECFSCVSNSNLTSIDKKKCFCNEGFIENDDKCVENYFEAIMSVISYDNKLKLKFTEDINVDLNMENVLISIQNVQRYSYSILKNDLKTYYIPLKFFEDVSEGAIVNVSLINYPIFSKNNKILRDYTYIGQLYPYLITSKIISVLANSTSSASKVAISASISMAIMANPSAAWVLLNTIQIVQYIPLNSNRIPEGTITFMSGLGDFSDLIPNPFLYIFDPNSTSEPYLQARNFGFDTSVFFINIGFSIAQFFIILSFWPLLHILSKFNLGKISLKIYKLLRNYRYSFFLRYWSQAYLDIGIAAIIQLRSVVFI